MNRILALHHPATFAAMTGAPRHTFSKAEKLKSRKQIDGLFQDGKSFFAAPVKCYYRLWEEKGETAEVKGETGNGKGKTAEVKSETAEVKGGTAEVKGGTADAVKGFINVNQTSNIKPQTSNIKCGVSVSKRNFKKAVDRNRIKRLLREAYRLHKAPLLEKLNNRNQQLELFFVFTDKTLPTFALVEEKMKYCMRRLGKIVEGGS